MDSLFPFGFPLPTAFYLSLYTLTWTVHALLMSYVLAGSCYLFGWTLVRARSGAGRRDPLAALLRDWLPVALGAAITAGVAPLLFLQILHKQSFYTANLLLLHRWMAVVPVLIVGFYLLYLAKSERFEAGSARVRVAVAVGAFVTLAFVAYSWTENHLLSLHRDEWTSFYASSRLAYFDDSLVPRAAFWLCLAFPLMAALTGWQLRGTSREGDGDERATTRSALLALLGVVFAAVFAVLYYRTLSEPARHAFETPMARPYLVFAAFGVLLQIGGWVWQLRQPRWSAAALAVATVGAVDTVLGAAVAREAIRLSGTDLAPFYAAHERAWQSGGLPVFLVFLVLGGLTVGWSVSITRRGLRGG